MNGDPILSARTIPAGVDGYRVRRTFLVEGGLHYIRGNHAPYFSLTYTAHRKGFPSQCYSGGAGHDEILRYWPQFADLAALHLSDIDGEPMHAEANGWYWLAGALGGAGERYAANTATNYAAGRPYTEAECLAHFARHCRISEAEAEAIRARVERASLATYPDRDWNAARDLWRAIVDDMRPRWKAEAAACIAAHNLRVYGDPWTPTTDEVTA